MKKIAKLLGILSIVIAGAMVPGNKAEAAMGDVSISDITFPDVVFKQYVKQFDLNSDGRLSSEERKKVQKIEVKDSRLTSLKGLEFFTELEYIKCLDSTITYANFSRNQKLTTLYIGAYKQDEIDLSKNTKLENLGFTWLHTGTNRNLDLSSNTELKTIHIQLGYMDTINISKSTKLEYLNLEGAFKEIDVSKNTKLEELYLESHYLKDVDLRNNKKLIKLWIRDNRIESLNLDNNVNLEHLILYTPKLKPISLEKNVALRVVWLEKMSWDELDLSKQTVLSDLTCQDSTIKKLKLNSDKLMDLDVRNNNGLEVLDLSHCSSLREAYNSGNKTVSSRRVTYKKDNQSIGMLNSVKVINNIVIYTYVNEEGAGTITGGGVYNTGDVVTIRVKANTNNAYAYKSLSLGWKIDHLTRIDGFVTSSDTYQFTAKEDVKFLAQFTNLAPFDLSFSKYSNFSYGGKIRIELEPMNGYYSLPSYTCQWYRGSNKISGATNEIYEITQADIGQKLTCVVTSSDGGKKSIQTSVIEKMDGMDADRDLKVKAPSAEGRADGKILGVNTYMEYSTSKDFKNKKKCPDEKMTVKAGIYYIRYAETAVRKAGETVVVKVPNGPSVTEVFDDLQKDAWYIDAVKYVYAKGIMNGVSGNKFEPMSVTTRAEFVTMLYNFAGAPKVSKKADFKDVGKGDWYENAVNWAYTYDITSGVSETKFGPDQKITRQQAAVMFYKYAVYKKLDTTGDKKALDKFSDKNKVESWAKTGLEWAVHQGVINGKLKGQTTILAPNDKITRAECAQMIKNMAERVKTKK